MLQGLRTVKCLLIATALFLAGTIASPSLSQAAKPGLYDAGLYRIEKDYRDGKLSDAQALNYRVAAIFHPEELPDVYRPTGPVRSATMVLREASFRRSQLMPENRHVLLRPTDSNDPEYYGDGVELRSYISQGRHFRLHYTTDNLNGDAVSTTDTNRNQTPDYVETYANYLEEAWAREVADMAFNPAPTDGSLGGDYRLDVYIKNINAYGVTVWENDPSDVYLIVENDYAGFPDNLNGDCANGNTADCREGSMKVTAAHEFFHTMQWQMTADVLSNGWWMEASAVWMEDAVFPEVKDYLNYISYWFTYPDLPLDTFDGAFEYGAVIWAKHLSEKDGEGIVRQIWLAMDDSGGVNALEAIEQVLADHGSSLDDELVEFRAKNAAVRYWDTLYVDGQYYLGPAMAIYGDDASTETYTNPVNGNCTFDISGTGPCLLSPLSAFYYLFLPPSSGTLSVAYAGDTTLPAASILILATTHPVGSAPTGNDYYVVSELSLDGSQHGQITVGPLGPSETFKRVMVVLLNADNTLATRGTLTVTFTAGGSAPASASSLNLNPQDISIDAGGKLQYTVLMRDDLSAQILVPGLSWSSDNPSTGNVDGNGLATMQKGGSIQVTSSLGGLVSQAVTLTGIGSTTRKSDGRCFIATAAYGTPLHPYVRILREFRDRYLLPYTLGRSFVDFYYEQSPALADWIARHEAAKTITATLLIPLVTFAVFMVKVSLLEKVGLLLVVLWGTVTVRRRFGCPQSPSEKKISSTSWGRK